MPCRPCRRRGRCDAGGVGRTHSEPKHCWPPAIHCTQRSLHPRDVARAATSAALRAGAGTTKPRCAPDAHDLPHRPSFPARPRFHLPLESLARHPAPKAKAVPKHEPRKRGTNPPKDRRPTHFPASCGARGLTRVHASRLSLGRCYPPTMPRAQLRCRPVEHQAKPCSPAQATALLHSLTPEARRPMQALPDCPAIEASSTTAPRQPTLLPFPTHPEIEASKVGTFSCSLRSGRPVSPSRPGRIDRAGPPISRSPLVPFPASTARAGRCIGGRPRPSN